MQDESTFTIPPSKRVAAHSAWIAALLVAVAAGAAYYCTAFRTITWWDSTVYTLASVTLGVSFPPGSLLLNVLGWVVTKLPLGISDAFALNLFAGFLAILTCAGVAGLAINMIRISGLAKSSVTGRRELIMAGVGAALGGLTLAFSETLWLYAIKFTPYILTTVFTVLIMWALLRWWETAESSRGWWWLVVAAFLFGLDFSVHRTNSLLLPGVLIWILLRRPRVLLSLRLWGASVVSLAAGLAVHLLVIPLAARNPFLNGGDPSNLSRFWDYVAVKSAGGGFLMDIFTRKAPLVTYQIVDYLNVFADNFVAWVGTLGVLGVLPLLLGLVGLLLLWLRDWRFGAGVTAMFLSAAIMAIVYFNIPADFFRSFERHYMPSLVVFSLFIAYGAASIVAAASYRGAGFRPIVAVLVVAIAPAYLAYTNYERVDGSQDYFAYDYGVNVLNTLPQGSIVFTSGDNDTFSLWYLQQVEGKRPDVTVVNLPLLNTDWFAVHVKSYDPSFPLALDDDALRRLRAIPWKDTTIVMAGASGASDAAAFELPEGTVLPDSISLRIPPTVQDRVILPQDLIVLRVVQDNQWRRPIYFTYSYSWLSPHLRQEGLALRLLPVEEAVVDYGILQRNLLERYTYWGYADSLMPLDFSTRSTGLSMLTGFVMLAYDYMQRGETDRCRETISLMSELLPPERVVPPENLMQAIEALTNPSTDSTGQSDEVAALP